VPIINEKASDYLKNTRRKIRSSPCIFQVVASLSIRSLLEAHFLSRKFSGDRKFSENKS
jgi:hypothetical protein